MIVEETTSTQDLLKQQVGPQSPEGTWVMARRQHAGRGRLGRTWQGLEGGLFLSVWLKPMLAPSALGRIPLAMAVAARDLLHPQIQIKWPNDLLLPQHLGRRKLGGILAEADVSRGLVHGVRVGIGVNILGYPEAVGAGALAELVDVSKLDLAALGEQMAHQMVVASHQAVSSWDDVRSRWEAAAAWRGETVQVGGCRGKLIGLAYDGALRLQLDNHEHMLVRTGDVSLVDFQEVYPS